MKKPIRKGSTVTMLRPYAVDPDDPSSVSIARGASVRVVAIGRDSFNGRLYTVTDGAVQIANLPRHVLRLGSST